jgi:predicted transcriptional regulator of viral defense system
MDTSMQDKIVERLRRQGQGKVFTPKDFLDLGSRESVDQALSRLAKAETVQRLGRGLYCYPKINKRLGIIISPDVDEIASALARQTGSRIAPSGAMAANRLGLSTQVPAKPVYLTDGRSRKVRIGNFLIVVKHVAPKELPVGNQISATVLQALRYLGKEAIDSTVINRIRKALLPKYRSRLLLDSRYTTDWIADAVRKIAGHQVEAVNHG